MSECFLSIYEQQRHLTRSTSSLSSYRAKIKKKLIVILPLLVLLSLLPILVFKSELERALSSSYSPSSLSAQASRVEEEGNIHGCRYGIAMGADLMSTQGILTLTNSVISNYQPLQSHHDSITNNSNLCIFVFSTEQDYDQRRQSFECATFASDIENNIMEHVKIIHKVIDLNHWLPRIYGLNEVGQHGMEYKWFRYYLSPNDVSGLKKVLYVDSDIIVKGNIVELLEWNMNGHTAAATNYWEPLRNHLCANHKLDNIAMKTNKHGLLFGTKTERPFETKNHINTGLLLLDLEQMVNRRILHKWSKLLDVHESEDCLWLDNHSGEADFTLAINNDVEVLPEEWNVGNLGTPEKYRLTRGCERGKALHWNGNAKPYTNAGRTHALCLNYFDMYDMKKAMRQNNPSCDHLFQHKS